jgi:hypothetical protein
MICWARSASHTTPRSEIALYIRISQLTRKLHLLSWTEKVFRIWLAPNGNWLQRMFQDSRTSMRAKTGCRRLKSIGEKVWWIFWTRSRQRSLTRLSGCSIMRLSSNRWSNWDPRLLRCWKSRGRHITWKSLTYLSQSKRASQLWKIKPIPCPSPTFWLRTSTVILTSAIRSSLPPRMLTWSTIQIWRTMIKTLT